MNLRSFGTHDGSFHADEITACSLLLLFDQIDRDKIVRSRDLKILEKCEYVCDVGSLYDPEKKRFDHHQVGYQGEMSSAGMVWKYLKDRGIVSEKLYDFFNTSLIWGVDAHDNGRSEIEPGVATFSHLISNFVPPIYNASAEDYNEAFFEALDFTYNHLKRLKERFEYIEKCRDLVEEAMQKGKKYLAFDHPMPWLDVFFDLGGEKHPALFVIMPSGSHWKLRGIPPNNRERMKVRVSMPEKWAGLMGQELKQVSHIPGAIFCHKGKFISVWETKEDALKALDFILKGD